MERLRTLFVAVILAGLTSLSVPSAHAHQTPPPSTPETLTVKQASIILKNANRAMDEVMLAGVPPTVDLNAEQCERILTKQKHIVSLSTYHTAQKIMMNAGRLTTENAGAQLKNQKQFLQHANNHLPTITKTCQIIGTVTDVSR